MSHFAELDENNVVLRVIVIEEDVLKSGHWGDPARWVQTSYNNRIRKRFAGVGFTYDWARDAFIPPRPSEEHVLDEESLDWVLPEAPADDN